MTKSTRTEQDGIVTYALIIDGVQVSFLAVSSEHRIVENVETEKAHRGNGYARMLWEIANAEGEVFHALAHHRTAEGDAFASAVGGDTISDELGFVDVCCICTGEFEE